MQKILTGLAVPRRSVLSPFSVSERDSNFTLYTPGGLAGAHGPRGHKAFHQHAEGHKFTEAELAAMDDGKYRKTVMDVTQGAADSVTKVLEENGKLRDDYTKLLGDLKKSETLTAEQASKLVAIEKQLLCLQRGIDPAEPVQEYFKRAFPSECKEIGEIISKGGRQIDLAAIMAKAESSASQPALIATQFTDQVYSRVVQYGAFRTLDARPMGAQTVEFIVETDEPVAVFVPENGNIPEVTLGLGPIGMTAKKIGVLIGISGELLQDSLIDLGAYVMDKFARAIARRADYASFMADGTNDIYNGGFVGLFNSGTVVAAAAGHTTIGKLTLADLLNWISAVPQAVIENGPKMWANPYLIPQFLGIADGNGRPLFLNALEAPSYGAIGTLMGYPFNPVSVAPTANAAGVPVAAFGDPMAYTVGLRMEYNFDYSDHARFAAFQRVYRALMRGAFKMKVPANVAVLKTAAA